MYQREYDAAAAGLDRILADAGAEYLSDAPGATNDEPGFSWAPCECCGSRLGGSRYEMVAVKTGAAGGILGEFTICADCHIVAAGVAEIDE